MITAIILAAGESKRMGQPKVLMPWGKSTILKTVISTFRSAGVDDVLVVTGGMREKVEALVGDSARTAFNENYQSGEMLSSIQVGLRYLISAPPDLRSPSPNSLNLGRAWGEAALICLGDQPQVEERSVRLILDEYKKTSAPLIVPSYQMKRGHPWLVRRELWNEILDLQPPQTLREFLNRHTKEIHYVEINSPTILQDLDTFEDYLKSRP